MKDAHNPSEEEIFAEALGLQTPEARAAYLMQACGGDEPLRRRVEALLHAHDHAGEFLDQPPAAASAGTLLITTAMLPVAEKPGDRIGRYKLLQKLGEGGCGVVYMAEQQEPVKRRVALKVIKPGMDTRQVLARFEAERQALALMDHPNIAKVLDAGATDTGRPFFVMELVRGVKITDYCDDPQNYLSTEQRLDLFIQICRAIQHAHQKGIIHRDIKPPNILITLQEDGTPTPKIIDFGIAKATAGQLLTNKTLFTAFEQFIGTPEYMSPEQAQMTAIDIDTRSDIYSLGVLLYELLTGKTPFDSKRLYDAGLNEIRRIISEEEPPRPSTRLSTLNADEQTTVAKRRQSEPPKLIHLVRGDLDWIVMKCLDKDRSRRYESANGLAMDIQRHLNNEPIVARPPSNAYRFQKMVRRNKVAFAAAGAVVTALLLGVVVSAWQAVRATRAEREQRSLREEAVASRQKAEAAEKSALTQAERAERNAAESRQNLGKLYVANGVRLMDEGDLSGCLSWFVQAMKLEKDNPARTEVHRRRLDSILRRSPNLVQIFFHEDDVRCAKFSPNGLHLLTASWDNSARVWDLATGLPVTPPMKHFAGVYDAAFSPDGRRIVTGSFDQTARVWNAATGEPITPPLAHKWALKAPTSVPESWANYGVNHVEFSPDGRNVTTSSSDGTARIWDSATGEPVAPPLIHGFAVRHASFSPDGKRTVTASQDGTAKVWETATGKLILTLNLRPLEVGIAKFSPDGRFIVTAAALYFKGQGGEARVWDATTGEPVTPPLRHGGDLTHVEFSPDGRSLVTASKDRTARVWNSATGEPVTPALRHDNSVMYASFSPDGQKVVTAGVDQTVRVWDAATGDPLTPPLQHIGRVWFATFSPDGRYLVSACDDHCARVWDLAPEELSLPIAKRVEGAYKAFFSTDGKKIVTVNSERAAQVFDTATGDPVTQQFGQTHRVDWASFSPDGCLVLTDGLDGTARVWDAATGRTTTPAAEHKGALFRPIFSPDGRRFVTGKGNLTVQIRDATTGEAMTAPLFHKQSVNAVSFSPDGSRLATAIGVGSNPSEARIWSAVTGNPVGLPMKHKGPVMTVAFSPDGRWLLTASGDKMAQVWDVVTCKPASPPLRHGSEVFWAEFSFDSRFVVTASGDGARVWNAATGKPITPALKHHRSVPHAVFSPDGALVLSDAGGCARVWDALSGEPVTPPFGHGTHPRTTFSPNGQWVVTYRWNYAGARMWNVSSSERSLEDYDLLSQMLTAHAMDGTGASFLLSLDDFHSHWRKLQSRQPLGHVGSNQVGLLWHARQAEECEGEKRWFGAIFHLKYLIDAEPQNQGVRRRYAAAQNSLGMTFLKGEGAPRDRAEALRLFHQAADQGSAEAQNNLGKTYEEGEGVAKDLEEAARWYRRAADAGSSAAVSSLLRMYKRSETAAKDPAEPAKWYGQAADQGSITDKYNLGRMYERGEGVPRDPAQAAKWYHKAAESGTAEALNELAWRLATSADSRLRDGPNAIGLAERAVAVTNRKDPNILDTLATAYAEAGDFVRAISTQEEAIGLLVDEQAKRDFTTRLKLYESNTPYRKGE